MTRVVRRPDSAILTAAIGASQYFAGPRDMLGKPNPRQRQRQPQNLAAIIGGSLRHRYAFFRAFSVILSSTHDTTPTSYTAVSMGREVWRANGQTMAERGLVHCQ